MPVPHHSKFFLQAGCPSCRPTNSVKALKAQNPRLKNKQKTLTPTCAEHNGRVARVGAAGNSSDHNRTMAE